MFVGLELCFRNNNMWQQRVCYWQGNSISSAKQKSYLLRTFSSRYLNLICLQHRTYLDSSQINLHGYVNAIVDYLFIYGLFDSFNILCYMQRRVI
jgi:hypothetical protein